MPTHRRPTELLELSGAFDKDPARRRPVGPKSDKPIGEPPPSMAEDEAAVWREHVRDAPAGVLTGADRWILEMAARLVAKSRREGLTGAELGHLRACLGELGATPAARRRVLPAGAAEAPPAANPWDVLPVRAPG